MTDDELRQRIFLDLALIEQNKEILANQQRMKDALNRIRDASMQVEQRTHALLEVGQLILRGLSMSEDWHPATTTPKRKRVVMVELAYGYMSTMPRFTVGHYVQDTKTWYVLDDFGVGWKQAYEMDIAKWRYFPAI